MTIDHSHPPLPAPSDLLKLFVPQICVLKKKKQTSLCLICDTDRLLSVRPPAGVWSSHKILPLKKVTPGLPAALPTALSCL